jgi:hypothetical protein
MQAYIIQRNIPTLHGPKMLIVVNLPAITGKADVFCVASSFIFTQDDDKSVFHAMHNVIINSRVQIT